MENFDVLAISKFCIYPWVSPGFEGYSKNVNCFTFLETQALKFVMHTTCALLLQEDEPCMVQDLLDRLGKIAPRSARNVPPTSLLYYRHDDHRVRTVNLEPKGRERINGHAHVKASFLSPFLIFWVVNGVIQLGEFQQILFFDFDDLGERRERQVSVTFISDNS